jgi:hypothetical protein
VVYPKIIHDEGGFVGQIPWVTNTPTHHAEIINWGLQMLMEIQTFSGMVYIKEG